MKQWLFLCPALVLCFGSFSAKGQTKDSSLYAEAFSYAVSVHDSQLKDQLPILNGAVFIDYFHHFSSGTPFFPPGHFEDGEIVYDGVKYEHIPLVYDMLAGQVIAELTLNLRLVVEKTSSFRILNHRFERIPVDIFPNTSGLYECLQNGYATLYKKTRKNLVAKSIPPGKETDFSIAETTNYLLRKEGHIYAADNEKEVIAALGDLKEQVAERFRTSLQTSGAGNYELRLLQIIAFYNDKK